MEIQPIILFGGAKMVRDPEDHSEEETFQRPIDHARRNGIRIAVLGSLILFSLWFVAWMVYSSFRIEVPTFRMAVLTKKIGKDITNQDEVAPDDTYKGMQRDVLTEGRYFRNPFVWEWRVMDQAEIESGKLGVLVSLTGDDLPYGEFLAQTDPTTKMPSKGIMPDVLRPGRYAINPNLFALEIHAPVTIPAGYKGIVTNLAGPMPKEKNQLLVQPGERGVQPEALDPGSYYLNPYSQKVAMVDCRSQRFNLAEDKDMGFPSKDGFWVTLDGVIEFRINPSRVANVYVTYNEDSNGEKVDEEIISKIIMPNARSFCRLQGSNEVGREFISGKTRSIFQDNFQNSLRTACEPLGIEIIQAVITRINPPQQIADPVRQREIAKQQEKQYTEQIQQQLAEQRLRVEGELVKQRQALVKSDQQVVTMTTEAMREQEVALTEARQRKSVAEFALKAAEDRVAAILARGKAEADVIQFGNEAEAAGWRNAVAAFDGDGNAYAQYVMFDKLASAYRQIMINTADSPLMKIFQFAADSSSRPAEVTPATTSPVPDDATPSTNTTDTAAKNP
jgi:regulator of protease activity HflC (stomatin/prohibitin superfamily)